MKKNFFKKLSFVLALAMIVSVIAPAAGALAATKAPKLNKTKVYLYLEQKDVYDFNVSNKGAYKNVEYVSADEDVAVVDEMGVTEAVGVGRTTITATLYNSKGEEYKTPLKATVVVRDNIAELEVSNLPSEKAKVGVAHDFDVTYTTEAGYDEGTSSYVAWEVLQDGKATELATIDADGKFVATEAGKFEVVARAFQTVDGFKLFDKDRVANAKYVLDEAKAEVEVAISITDVKLLEPKKLQVTFDSSVKDVVKAAADIKVSRKLTDTYSAMVPVWTLDKVDGKVVTFTTYDALVDKQTYTVTAAGATFELYAQIGEPVSIVMLDQTIAAGEEVEVAYQLIDQYGVDVKSIKGGSVAKSSSVPFVAGKPGFLKLGADQVAFVEYSYVIVNADGSTTPITTGTKSVKGVAASVGSTLEWTIDKSDFSAINTSIKVGESKVIYGRIKMSNGEYTPSANYKFESLSQSLLLIDYNTNTLIPIAAGTALVKVTDLTNTAYVSYINVEVKAAPATSYIKADKSAVKLSNSIMDGATETYESATVTISQVDQYNNETAVSDLQEHYFVSANRSESDFVSVSASGNALTFTAKNDKVGTVNYYVKAADKTVTFTVTVLSPGTLYTYAVNTSADSIDAYVANGDTASDLDITVYGVDANGTKKEKVKDLSATSGVAVKYTVKNSEGTALVDNATFTGTANFAVDDTNGAVKTGTYTITVSIGGINYVKTFTVNNSRPTAQVSVKALSTTATQSSSVNDAVARLLGFKIGDDDTIAIKSVDFASSNTAVVDADGINFKAADGTATLYIYKVVVTDDAGFDYEVAINAAYTVVVD